MKKIHGKKRLWGKTKMWMKLMKSDGEVQVLREKLRKHIREILVKFEVSTLVQMKKYIKVIGEDVVRIKSTTQNIHHDVRTGHGRMESRLNSVMLSQQSSEEELRLIHEKLEELTVQNIQTPVLSPIDLENDGDLFELDYASSLPSSPLDSPPGTPPSPEECWGYLTHNSSSDTFTHCSRSDCDAYSIVSGDEFTHSYVAASTP